MELKKRCFSTGCFGSWKKHKKVHEQVKTQTLSPNDEQLDEAVTLLGATTESESPKEKKPVTELDQAKSEEEQMNCETKLLEYENRNLLSRTEEPESSESLFSLSIDSRKQVFTVDTTDKEVTSPLKPNNNRSKSSSSSSSSSSFKLDENNKENVGLTKQSLVKTTVDTTTTTVTTSLSGWLNLSHKSNIIKSNSNSSESEKNYAYAAGKTAKLKQMNAGGDSKLISPARD
ncbi:hypothetical protein CASFOL_023070 [Castilleja foliolosa]|uniref:Uncharacterized protein n=1 Tax=Castilleja foliolosa TaxID=1961234 RepID=A0ABD3CMC0_9LAMI